MKFQVRDESIYQSGLDKIEWASRNMPVLNKIKKEFEKEKPLKGVKIALSIHMEAKTAYLVQVLASGGAQVSATGCNPLSTQDDVAAALAHLGYNIYAWRGATKEEYKNQLALALACEPNIVIDDGADLTQMVHSTHRHLLKNIWGGCEETTTGVKRLHAMEKDGVLEYPILAINDAYCKYLFDNRYGTGQSVWDGIMRTTNVVVAGKNVVVAGYGWCGKGVAMRAKGLGAKVIVTEIDPVKAVEAAMDGFNVMKMEAATHLGDIFITVTGCNNIITKQHYGKMKDGAILANAGHFNVEINIDQLKEGSKEVKEVRNNILGYKQEDGRWIYLLGEGRLVNLAAGDGHPIEIMDMSFALQAKSAVYVTKNYKTLEKKVYSVPKEIDYDVAYDKLKSMGLEIDSLDSEQEKYIKSWDF